MSLQRRNVNQHRVAHPVAHVLFWAPLQGTCWKHFRDVEREASDSYWYLATCNINVCAERLRLNFKDGSSSCAFKLHYWAERQNLRQVPPEISFVGLSSSAHLQDRLPSTPGALGSGAGSFEEPLNSFEETVTAARAFVILGTGRTHRASEP